MRGEEGRSRGADRRGGARGQTGGYDALVDIARSGPTFGGGEPGREDAEGHGSEEDKMTGPTYGQATITTRNRIESLFGNSHPWRLDLIESGYSHFAGMLERPERTSMHSSQCEAPSSLSRL